jgi:diguanylate cyclase (GGDEF)-like protein
VDQGVTGWVVASGRPRRNDEVAESPEYLEVDSSVRSELCVPLKVENKVIGVFNAESFRRAAFTEADEGIMLTLAGQLAMAIDRLRAEVELSRLATLDELTGLYNRRSFFAQAERKLKRDHSSRKPTCAIMLDIDHFKPINDTYGHPVGDRVLRRVADCCQRSVRDVDLIGRYGGEEFVVLLSATDLSSALHVAERLRADVEKSSFLPEYGDPHITISLGVAEAKGERPDLSGLLNNADIAMYAAKQAGRNRVVAANG